MPNPGTLFLVATPIGNLEDITLRALRVLKEVDVILAEDTRHTRKLCTHYDITTPLRSHHAHSAPAEIEKWLAAMEDGQSLALVTDAGTPLISDPGATLAKAALERNLPVTALPGASAVLGAVTLSGLVDEGFRFVGFIPRKGSGRHDAIRAIAEAALPTVLFESPKRIRRTLADLAEVLPEERRVSLCRELTKVHEETIRGPIGSVLAHLAEAPRGEMVLVVAGNATPRAMLGEEGAVDLARTLLAQGLGTREVAKEIARATNMTSSEAYRVTLDVAGRVDGTGG